MTEPFIALCYPSRGMGHDRTSFGAFRELRRYPHILCPAFGLPMPDSHNLAAEQALADARVTHLWFVENDHLLPPGVLAALLDADAPVVAAPYTMHNAVPLGIRDKRGALVLVGLGCTLIRRDVFAKVPTPPFQINADLWDRKADAWGTGETAPLLGLPRPHALVSGPDTYFCRELRRAGIPIAMLDDTWQVGHLAVMQRGQTNAISVDQVRMDGGQPDYPWAPSKEVVMPEEIAYLKSASGTLFIDMVKSNRNYKKHINAGWTEITKAEYDKGRKDMEAMFENRREEIRKEKLGE